MVVRFVAVAIRGVAGDGIQKFIAVFHQREMHLNKAVMFIRRARSSGSIQIYRPFFQWEDSS